MGDAEDAPRPPAAAIRPDARIAAVGATGTGKSTVLRWLWATQMGARAGHTWRVLVDAQDAYELVPEAGVWQGSGVDAIDWRAPVIRVVPNPEDPSEYERLYRELNRRPRVATWMDEAALAPRPGTREGGPIRAYQTTGRKYLRAHLVATQFPVAIDRTLIDQAEHHLVFVLRRPEDRDRMARITGLASGDELRRMLAELPAGGDGRPPHGFLWSMSDRDGAVLRPALPAEAIAQADRLVIAVR